MLTGCSTQNALPDGLQADSIWVKQADGGFHVVFGQDIKSKVDAVLQRCGQPNAQCHRDVVKVLEGAIVQTDKHLERRMWGTIAVALVQIWGTVGQFVEIIGAFLVALYAVHKGASDAKGYHIPESAASSAAKLPMATPITVSAAGSAIVTITKAPDAKYTLQG